jgi:hypothetical protein
MAFAQNSDLAHQRVGLPSVKVWTLRSAAASTATGILQILGSADVIHRTSEPERAGMLSSRKTRLGLISLNVLCSSHR